MRNETDCHAAADRSPAKPARADADLLSPPASSATVPLLERIALAYLAAPLAIWLLGWFKPWVGIPAVALLVVGLRGPLSGPWRVPKPSRTIVAAALCALVATLLSPAGGFLLVAGDWEAHRAVFLELATGGWPTYLADYLDGEPLLLRYYLGWHLVPALVARIVGVASLNWTIPLWTWCGTALLAALFVRRFLTLRAAALALAVLSLFSGADVADVVLSNLLQQVAQSPAGAVWLDYQPSMRTFRLTPQHFIPAGIGSLLVIRLRTHPRFVAAMGVVVTACLFWSPFVAAGLLPLAAAALAGSARRRSPLGWRSALAVVPVGGLAALYLLAGELNFQRGWIWELWESRWHLAARLAILYATEFLLLVFLVMRIDARRGRDPLLCACVVVLVLVPVYVYGLPLNEWGIRVQTPSLALLSYYVAGAVASRLPEMAGGRPRPPRAAWGALVAMLVVGAGTPVREMLNTTRIGPFAYERTGESLLADVDWRFVRQRIAPKPPAHLTALLMEPGRASRQPSALLIRSGYDVYYENGGRLVYAKPNCDWEAEHESSLFLEIRYGAGTNLSAPGSRRPPWDYWVVHSSGDRREFLRIMLRHVRHYAEGRGCTVSARLSPGSVTSIRTGQVSSDGRLLWAVERSMVGDPGVPSARPLARR